MYQCNHLGQESDRAVYYPTCPKIEYEYPNEGLDEDIIMSED